MNEVFNQLSKIAGDIGAVTENMRKTLGARTARTTSAPSSRTSPASPRDPGIIERSQSRVDSILGNVQSFTGNLRNIGAGASRTCWPS